MYKFSCPYYHEGCSRRFRSQSGCTYHVRSAHSNYHNIIHHQNENGPENGPENENFYDDNLNQELPVEDYFAPPAEHHNIPPPAPESPTTPQRNIHPHINGILLLTLFFLLLIGNVQGRPCDRDGLFLPPGTPPSAHSNPSQDEWDPFDDQTQFRMGEFLYKKVEMSAGDVDKLMDIWATLKDVDNDEISPFSSHEYMYTTIDDIKHGDAPWKSFTISYTGHLGPDPPTWQLQDYQVWYRDPDVVITNLLDNPDFDGEFNYAPYVEMDKSGQRQWNEPMSGNFAWRHADTIFQDNKTTEGALYCPIILGADKTTVSVAMGHVEYHPLYLSLGNIHNTVRRTHRNAVVPIGFLAIPKSRLLLHFIVSSCLH